MRIMRSTNWTQWVIVKKKKKGHKVGGSRKRVLDLRRVGGKYD